MKIYAAQTESHLGKPDVYVEHNGEEIKWVVGAYEKRNIVPQLLGFDLFDQINGYWNSLPRDKQNDIFNCYKKLRNILDTPTDTNKLRLSLVEDTTVLLNLHDYERVLEYVKFKSNINIPTSLASEYIQSDFVPGTRDQTYIRDDYIGLCALIVVIRTMIPVWGEFIALTKVDAGTQFKEFYALQLIQFADINFSEPMEKLRTYISHSIGTDKDRSAAIIGGLSTEEFPVWVLGLTISRKLVLSDIRGIDNSQALIAGMHKFIISKEKSTENSFNRKGNDGGYNSYIRKKDYAAGMQAGDDNISILEGFKIKQELAAGDVVYLEYFANDHYRLAKSIDPTVDDTLITNALITSKDLVTRPFYDPQIILAQWIVSGILPPKSIHYLPKDTVSKILAISQALLLHWKHFTLAALVTATALDDSDELAVYGGDSRSRITKEQNEELNTLFPFFKKASAKPKTTRPINQAIMSIDNLTALLEEANWYLTIDSNLLEMCVGSQNRRFSIPNDIKQKLADLVIDLAKRRGSRSSFANISNLSNPNILEGI